MFEVPASKASIDQNKFKFKLSGKQYSLPKFTYLPMSVMETIEGASADSISPYLNIFGAKGTPLGDAVRSLDKDQFTALIQAWRDDSQVKPGESGAS